MSNQHTPGPWTRDGNNIRSADGKWPVCIVAGVRTIGGSDEDITERQRESDINEANAKIIAEAPAMMEALEGLTVLGRIESGPQEGAYIIGPVGFEQARAILQRVRGES